jgi:hypothetical protein
LIGVGRGLLESETGTAITAFRAGSYAVNADTYSALCTNGIYIDSSLNTCFDFSSGTLGDTRPFADLRWIDGVCVYPVTVMQDGFGRLRAAQLNGCSRLELSRALDDASRKGVRHFVIVSHNFEMLKDGTSEPDWVVVRRFEGLCRFLAEHTHQFHVKNFAVDDRTHAPRGVSRPRSSAWATAQRFAEQALRAVR